MSRDRFSAGTTLKHSITGFALLLLAACAAPAPVPPEGSLEPPYELVVNAVVDSALDDLLIQMRRLPAFARTPKPDVQEAAVALEKKDAAVPPRTVIAVDRSVSKIGRETVATEVLDSLLLQTARQKLAQFEVLDASPAVLDRVQYILGAKLAPVDSVVSTSRGTFRVDLLLTELKTSHIVAQASVRFSAQGVDLRPIVTGGTH